MKLALTQSLHKRYLYSETLCLNVGLHCRIASMDGPLISVRFKACPNYKTLNESEMKLSCYRFV